MNTRKYHKNEVVTFRKTTEKFGALSNMASGFPVNINGIIIPSSEHLYQACKFPLFPAIQQQIIEESNPMLSKKISRKFEKFVRQDWDQVKIKVMRWALEIKLSQNWERFCEELESTKNSIIVEYTKEDKIWGAVPEGDYFIGTNALGRLLMELREKYAKPQVMEYCVEPLYIPAFLLYNHEIGVVCNDQFHAEIEHSLTEVY